ncbi:titin-like [Antedon mediterranea]|uniref:titin-like n=1 Tax=Antedon mediterranea TaxID=105859 RepID=UPI003AF9A832
MARILILILCGLCFEYGCCTPQFSDGILQNVTTYAGENASFTCTLEFPNNQLTHSEVGWQKNGEWIEIDDIIKYVSSKNQVRRDVDGIIVTHEILLIKNVEMKDAGRYTCRMYHKQHVMKSAWLTVHRKILPNPECSHDLRTQQLEDTVTTTCTTAAGEPPVHIQMYKIKPSGEKTLVKEGYQSLNQLRLEFMFKITRENIADLIVCESSIPELRGFKSCKIDLLGEMIHNHDMKEEIRVVPLNQQPILVGEEACFLCNVYGTENVNVMWSFDGRHDFTSKISRQYKHCFKDLQLSDNGKVVRCDISSDHTEGSSSAVIQVVEEKIAPSKESVTAKKEIIPTPELRVHAPSDDVDEHTAKNKESNLVTFKIFLVGAMLVIVFLAVAIVQLISRMRRTPGGMNDFARLSTISDRDIDQRYQSTEDNSDDHMSTQTRLTRDTNEDEHCESET